ncbi:proton-conducting membrane transporter [Alkalibacter rhizosphaerae]|uniref:Proton-conducting membrane transporter n=1 Tax=Alkalibacter rhizosphaerae TaxID=2815577 RepID=A0A975AIE5_9FIRM|nr:proton-conducting transporter membrane subunit [Alkalibacter rhizosphaerae]QSX08993.1 proton-conducting membrane transporter [Alkalibacter rhizosphaerae]
MVDLHWLVLFPVIVGSLGMLIPAKTGRRMTLALHGVLLLNATILLSRVRVEGTIVEHVGNWPTFIGITLRADLLAASMVWLTSFLFLMTVLFNYRKKYSDRLFLFLFTVLEGLITGIFLSNDLFNIFVLVEVATVVISILIMYKQDSRSIYDGMLYLLINIVGMSFFLFGLGMLYKRLGVIDLTGLKLAVSQLDSAKGILLPYAFIITAVSLKSALMPLFSWLPKAHGTPSAPSIVSAVLSGLYVKNGLYLFIRIQDVFSSVLDTSDFFLLMGFITAVIGFLLAIAQKDMKLILAYHTVSQIGLIMMGLNMGRIHTYWGAVYHILNHAVFKTALFLTAGMIIDEYGTRNVYEVKGLMRKMPAVGMATLFAILGITGAPLFNGSISKYLLSYGATGSWVEYGLILVNLGTIVSFIKYGTMLFGGEKGVNRAKCDPLRKAVVMVMGSLCLVGGIFGRIIIQEVYNVTFVVDPLAYWMKTLIFLGSVVVASLLYFGILRKRNYLAILNSFELSFNGVCGTIAGFFVLILVYVGSIV